MKAVKMSPAKSRIHAMSAYGVARYYKLTGNFDLYEKYLVEASVSDGLCQLKETLALQKLAYFLFKRMQATVRELPNTSSTRWKTPSSSTTDCA